MLVYMIEIIKKLINILCSTLTNKSFRAYVLKIVKLNLS